jgi:hypothetical protein
MDRHLEANIRGGRTWTVEPSIREAARRLARFYRAATPASVTAAVQRARLEAGVGSDLEAPVGAELAAERRAGLFEQRVRATRRGTICGRRCLIDGEPAIIDRLSSIRRSACSIPQFSRLDLECERLAHRMGGWFLEVHVQETGELCAPAVLSCLPGVGEPPSRHGTWTIQP